MHELNTKLTEDVKKATLLEEDPAEVYDSKKLILDEGHVRRENHKTMHSGSYSSPLPGLGSHLFW